MTLIAVPIVLLWVVRPWWRDQAAAGKVLAAERSGDQVWLLTEGGVRYTEGDEYSFETKCWDCSLDLYQLSVRDGKTVRRVHVPWPGLPTLVGMAVADQQIWLAGRDNNHDQAVLAVVDGRSGQIVQNTAAVIAATEALQPGLVRATIENGVLRAATRDGREVALDVATGQAVSGKREAPFALATVDEADQSGSQWHLDQMRDGPMRSQLCLRTGTVANLKSFGNLQLPCPSEGNDVFKLRGTPAASPQVFLNGTILAQGPDGLTVLDQDAAAAPAHRRLTRLDATGKIVWMQADLMNSLNLRGEDEDVGASDVQRDARLLRGEDLWLLIVASVGVVAIEPVSGKVRWRVEP